MADPTPDTEPPWPDWRDHGRQVEVVCGEDDAGVHKGETVQGTLHLEDVGFDGENEYPLWRVQLDPTRSISFAMVTRWTFLSLAALALVR